MKKRKIHPDAAWFLDRFLPTINPSGDVPAFKTYKEVSDWIDREERRDEIAHEAFDLLTKSRPEIASELWFAFLLGQASGRCAGMLAARSLISAAGKRLKALEGVNVGKNVSDAERTEVLKADDELAKEFPQRAIRYREIARRLSSRERPLKEGRVRFIVEGPRKSRKK